MAERNHHVFIVEDDDDIRETLRLVLEMHGHSVSVAADGAEALERLRQEDPCVVLLDLMMPRMDAWEFRARQREDPRLAAVPIVILSGVRGVLDRGRELEPSGVLQKPVDVTELIESIDRACTRGEPGEP